MGKDAVITFDGDAFLPGALISAAVISCKGHKLGPERFITELDVGDYQDILVDQDQAHAFAESLARRLA